jgi:hypothetical protein
MAKRLSNKPALPASDLFAFSSHGRPTTFGRGDEAGAQAWVECLNRHRALDWYSYRPVLDEREVPEIENIFLIKEALNKMGVIIRKSETQTLEYKH